MGKKRNFKPWKKFNKKPNQNNENIATVKCAKCEVAFKSPFRPREDDNIFCKNCFKNLIEKQA